VKPPGTQITQLYPCTFARADAEPIRIIALGDTVGTVSKLCYSQNRKLLLIGTRNGVAQVRPVNELDYFFHTEHHHGLHGCVTDMATSFDSGFMLSVGTDGNFFGTRFDMAGALDDRN
jgi:hypothetical protein